MALDPLISAALGAGATGLVGWVGMVIKHSISLSDKKMDEASIIRTELRIRCDKLEAKIDLLTVDNDTWKAKYFQETSELKSLNSSLKSDLAIIQLQLKSIQESQHSSSNSNGKQENR